MDKPLVVVTRKIPEAGLVLLREKYELKVNTKDRALSADELKKIASGAHAILALLTDKINEELLAAAGHQLKVVANYAVGFDNIDLAAAKKHKVAITNTPGVLTEAVAEHTIALLMAVARRVVESDKFTRSGKYEGWEPELLLGHELKDKTIGILGLGRIGGRVAEIAARGFGMKIIYYDNGNRNKEMDASIGSESVSMRKVLTGADVISIHVPLLPSTKHLIGKQELESMKKNTILINTSRGPVIDEKALASALGKKTIAGAGIDVFEFEPQITKELLKLDNIVMTPHTASATIETRDAMAVLAAKNIIAVLEGRAPVTPV
ncbi:MAG: hypothetical protein A3C85_01445 [Candidatus Doudnabacteria bacterium RIFCSPHIGHO2_02_FULL_48_21]|nr:MAG: hypothetical protein A3K05_03065 [Candidatus Doudnabacteria bacterium RIFCSPHIGHO2_01_48_18]OGE79818.1 MAG: hypothetical protein A2668_02770 [Candidatus Doudnabacteria bacterium RIFCSPHIGHO2_01_FULL_48_180]OGE90932.1 MAG: hypothetical protein A3F44_03200 [Candidatus Doudnabacteria bacterium RIFCSPHIGHO2_12_FULL_47_25]OGE93948.1 MAG: hypothetical protein A3C85_01445 [Candidatus Doudnabacteria bacterium RIFCSPHIGHO2_02_FULL_48_21]OGE97214.1 MAG: hypothetical protein A3A83_03885 [Candidatu